MADKLASAGGFGLILLLIASVVFWIIALVDVIRRSFDTGTIKVTWICVVLFLQFPGALIYWAFGRPSGYINNRIY